MKKFLIVVLSIFCFNNAFAESSKIEKFNFWLYENGYHQYLTMKENPVCKTEPKYSYLWYHNKCDKFQGSNNLNIKIKNKALSATNIAYHSNPNRDTLIYYLWKYSYRARGFKEFKSTNNSYDFKFNLIEDEFIKKQTKTVKKQMKTKGILSYLYYQDGEVLIDEFSPKERLGEFLNNETKFYSMSMSKSLVSYMVGHAICEGYIDGVDARVNDWPIIKDSLYHDQKLINFLNMNTGDQKYIDEFKDGTSKLGAYEDRDIETTMRLHFRNKNTKKSKERYNYNGFVTQLIFNYIRFKTGEDYKKFYSKIFNDKVKIKHSILYNETRNAEKYSNAEKYGNGHQNISATRFDYLRIAKAIMDDYQNDTCVGKYLKEIYERRIPKGSKEKEEPLFNRTKSYGGQFHMDFPGLKDKIIFGMGGYGGNMILIDVENSRILVLNSLHYNNKQFKYNHKKLILDPFKKGKQIN